MTRPVPAPLNRPAAVLVVLLLVGAFVAGDLARSRLPDMFAFPAIVALGSGEAASGGHCSQ